MLIYIIRCEGNISVTKTNYTRSNFKGGPPLFIRNLTVLNSNYCQFDCFEHPPLTVLYTYKSMCAVNTFLRCKSIYTLIIV